MPALRSEDKLKGFKDLMVADGTVIRLHDKLAEQFPGARGKAELKIHTASPSIGYGANFNGLAALLCMLNSCASGVGVVNIDNGFGAAPAPAALEILSKTNVPVYKVNIDAELVTPTGAALIAVLAEYLGRMPPMSISKVAYGAGKQELKHPNLLRLIIGEILDNYPNVLDINLFSGQFIGLSYDHVHCSRYDGET